ncbi:glycerophosphodiester phosphodiesterase family protein [Arcanobacterium buesumense]|uniref:Glycerophosphodiester phosphodiesterase n=1 Tax=Arcanobacterium buesumense TaxID=2722751 RepID=A0A6H2EKK0_9ACTO|nr:glycerophosphodiester phosphodiesterase family protein [Arcanobacterium buesumense]QJC21361.1 glycerophosphodiester phosphodiesterase [Arcanobacterium buesumense]
MPNSRLWDSLGEPVIIAHRGGAIEAPENTRYAFELMRYLNFRYIETDVRSTKDGIAVIVHDRRIDRVSSHRGRVCDYTWEELSAMTDHSGGYFMRLDEVLSEFPDMIFNVDAKENRVVEPLINAIEAAQARSRVCVASFSERRLRRLRRALPGIASSLSVLSVIKLFFAVRSPRAIRSILLRFIPGYLQGVQAVQVPREFHGIEIVNQAFVEAAREQGWAVHVWTVNDTTVARRLLDLGVQGIITDIPQRMASIWP